MLDRLTEYQESVFYAHLKHEGDCLVWTASRNRHGYGRLVVGLTSRGNKRMELAHRIAWVLAHPDDSIDGLCICHHCDNPPCCRVDHLFAGTHADNMRDRDAKGRQARCLGEQNSRAKLKEGNILEIRASNEPPRVLARLFGVTVPTICNIRMRRLWDHVP